MLMSLHDRVDRYVSSRPPFEFLLIYVVCFAAILPATAIRRLGRLIRHRPASGVSIFGEANSAASIYAASSFMGM
jgi:hypothetical protein